MSQSRCISPQEFCPFAVRHLHLHPLGSTSGVLCLLEDLHSRWLLGAEVEVVEMVKGGAPRKVPGPMNFITMDPNSLIPSLGARLSFRGCVFSLSWSSLSLSPRSRRAATQRRSPLIPLERYLHGLDTDCRLPWRLCESVPVLSLFAF